jgi:hypothetical protein
MAEEGVLGELIDLGDVMARAPAAGGAPLRRGGGRGRRGARCPLRATRAAPAGRQI